MASPRSGFSTDHPILLASPVILPTTFELCMSWCAIGCKADNATTSRPCPSPAPCFTASRCRRQNMLTSSFRCFRMAATAFSPLLPGPTLRSDLAQVSTPPKHRLQPEQVPLSILYIIMNQTQLPCTLRAKSSVKVNAPAAILSSAS